MEDVIAMPALREGSGDMWPLGQPGAFGRDTYATLAQAGTFTAALKARELGACELYMHWHTLSLALLADHALRRIGTLDLVPFFCHTNP